MIREGRVVWLRRHTCSRVNPRRGFEVMNRTRLPPFRRPLKRSAEHTTCFDGSETPLPSGYTKGRHLRVTAFSRSIASSGNDFQHRLSSQNLLLATPRDSRRAIRRRPDCPISAKTLGCLCVARGLG